MSSRAPAALWRRPAWQPSLRGITAIVGLAILAIGLTMPPLKWVAVGLGSITLMLLVVAKPATGMLAVALGIPFGDLVQLPGGANLVDVLVGLTIVGWLARGVADRRIVFRRPPLTAALLALVWCLALSLTQALSWREGVPEWLKWVEFTGIYLVATQVMDQDNVWWVLGGLFVAGLAEVALGAYQFFSQAGPEAFILQGRFMRAYGTFRQPNPYAGYLGYLAPVASSLALGACERWWTHRRPTDLAVAVTCGVTTGGLITGIIMSWSRGGWMGLLAGVLAVLGLRSRRTAALALIALALLAGGIAAGGIAHLPEPIAARISDLSNYIAGLDLAHTEITDANFSVLERLAHWQAGQRMFNDHPWLGVGIGNFGLNYATYASPHWYVSLGHAHNVVLNFLAETGAIGTTAFGVFWLGVAWLAGRIAGRTHGYRSALAIGVLGTWFYVSVHSMFDNLFVSHIQLQLALLLGALVAIGNMARPEIQPAPGRFAS